MLGSHLSRRRTRLDSTRASVIRHAIDRHIVDGLVINVVDVCDVYVVNRAVVVEIAPAPLSAVITVARISETVVNAAVESHGRSPISWIPCVEACCKGPITRRPQQAYCRRQHPGSGNPVVVVIIGTPCPVAGDPVVAGPWTNRLGIDRNHRRAETDADRHRAPRGKCCGNEQRAQHR